MQNTTTNIAERQLPKLVIVLGLPGSGKSYFAKRLAAKLNAEYINSDLLRKKFSMSGKYSQKDKTLVYLEMEKLAEGFIQAKRLVVVDATFYLRKLRDRFISLSQRLFCPYYLIQIVTDEELAVKRVSKPRKDSEADYAVYQLLKKEFESVDSPHLTISSTGDNIDQMLELAYTYIEEQGDE